MEAAPEFAPANDQNQLQDFRSSPANLEVEQALLGAILVNNNAYDRVSDFLKPEHFYEPIHQLIYEEAGKIIRMDKIANPITIKTFLPADQQVGEITLVQYLARLAGEATTIINAIDYGRVIQDLAIRRSLIEVGEEVVNIAYDAPSEMTPRDQIESAEKRLFELAETGGESRGFVNFSTALTQSIEMAGAAFQRDGQLSGCATGLTDLDHKMGGLQSSDLIILAARPGMGKTSLATNIAYNVASAFEPEVQADGTIAAKNGGRVGFFSLEMSAEQLATRVISEQAEVSSSKIRRGEITPAEYDKLTYAVQDMQSKPLFIDQTGGISIAQLSTRARRLKRQHGLDLLVIDYVQLMSGSSKNAGNRVQEITEITTGLKALAKELQVPIIALSQLSRAVENRDDKHPQLSDLRESGSIEQDADVVIFIYREEYYLQNKEPSQDDPAYAEWFTKMEKARGIAEVIVAKQRHGPTGTVPLSFTPQFTRFSDLADSSRLPEQY